MVLERVLVGKIITRSIKMASNTRYTVLICCSILQIYTCLMNEVSPPPFVYIYVAYSWPNGWIDWAEIFCGHSWVAGGCYRLKKNSICLNYLILIHVLGVKRKKLPVELFKVQLF